MAILTNTHINELVNAYNKNIEYVFFNESNQGIKAYDLGYICVKEGETTNAIESTMIPFDPLNKYMKKQADYNLGMFYSDLKFQEEEHINKNPLNITDGLSCIIVPGYFYDDYNYFINNSHIQAYSNITDFSSLSAATNNYSGNSKFSVEWFGYFKPENSGTYTFATISDDSSLLWIGEEALVSYNMDNLNVDNRGLHGNQKRENIFDCEANKLYPIRIQYGQDSVGQSFQLLIYRLNKDKPNENIKYNLLKTAKIGDSPYEPIQMFYSIKQPNGAYLDLGYIHHTKYEINNNYVNNQALRSANANPKLVYTDIVISQKTDSITFNAQGNLMAGSQNLTNLDNDSCSGLVTPKVTGVWANGTNYTNSSKIEFIQHENKIRVKLPQIPNSQKWWYRSPPVIQYDLGEITNQYYTAKKYPSSYQIIEFSVQKIINKCLFTFELSNNGELSVLNSKKQVWSSFKNTNMSRIFTKAIQTTMNNAVVNNAWLKDNQNKIKNLEINDTLSKNGLISQDGRFKLVVNKENNLVLRYCTKPGPSSETKNIHYLYGVPHDPFRGKTFIANNDKKTLRYIPITENAIIGFSNTYTTKKKNENSPSTFGKNYNSPSNIESLSACESECNKNNVCSHYWFNSKTKECNINTDGSHSYIYPDNNSNQITLGIRDQKVNSECVYSKPPYINSESIVGLTDYSLFADYKILPKVDTDINIREYEGPCSDPNIMDLTKSLESKPKDKFTNLSHNTIEGMAGYISDAGMGGESAEKNKKFLGELGTNINYLEKQSNQINKNNIDISNNYASLNKIGLVGSGTFAANYANVINNNNSYDVVDSNGNLLYDKTNPLYTNSQDVLLKDNNDILVQQNLMYMIGAITAATCLVGALVIGQK